MCDWGGGPNQAYNYLDYSYRSKPKPRTIYCMFSRERAGRSCGEEIHGFTGSTIYGPEHDPVMKAHLEKVFHYYKAEYFKS